MLWVMYIALLSTVSALAIDTSTIVSEGCFTCNIGPQCVEDVSSSDFSVTLVFGTGPCQTVRDLSSPQTTTMNITSSSGVCIPVGTTSVSELCYVATLMHQSTVIINQTNLDFDGCSVASLEVLLGSGVVYTLGRVADNGMVPHSTTASFGCRSAAAYTFSGASSALCLGGNWVVNGANSCSGNFYNC